VRNENAGADEAEKPCNHLDHRICPKAPLCRTETTGAAAQSKGFRTACKNRNPTDDLEQHRGPETSSLSPVCGTAARNQGRHAAILW
jgi:hypothetical protein